MSVPWKELGLTRFLAIDVQGCLLFENGTPCPEGMADSSEGLPQVAYFPEKVSEAVIDLHLLSRTLLPTLPEHSLSSLCAHYGIRLEAGEERGAIGLVFAALIAEGLAMERDLLSLLGQLLPGATGALLSGLVPWGKVRRPPSKGVPSEEPVLAPIGSVEEVLGRDGLIGQGLAAFEDRPGQREMAKLVSRTFEEGGTSVIEAGSGTGKTFAYLIPALLNLRCCESARLVVSTRTKQLQEQLYTKDLPFLVTRLAPQLKVALLKGRKNYLCLRRWQRVLGELIEGLERDLLPSLAPLASWLFRTQTGDIEDNCAFLADVNGNMLWSRLRDEPQHCVGQDCAFFDDCFSAAARRRAKGADLVVVNHSLLLADLLADHGILGDYQVLIVDEAHALEQTARQAMTSTLTQGTLDRLLTEIHPPSRRRGGGWLARLPFPHADRRVERVRTASQALRGMNVRLFTALAEVLPTERRDRFPLLEDLRPQAARMQLALDELKTGIESIGESLDDQETQREADGLIAEAEAIASLLGGLFSPPAKDSVHWYERKDGEIALHVSPLEVATFLKETLYPKLDGLVLTSATLSLGGEFTYLRESLCLDAAPKKNVYSVVQTPFDYDERMRIYYTDFLPPVDGPGEVYAREIASFVGEVAEATHKKILVLFTSYQLLRAVHERLVGDLVILAQGMDGSHSKMIERFRNSEGGAILLGTDTFWEGVDFPGETLEVLIITRLPFPVPTDPILSALAERLESAGRDPFWDLFVPLAILKLRQGVGRLIRTKSDRGAVVLTDRRVLRKSYGPLFTVSLPVAGRWSTSSKDLLSDLASWFGAS